MLGFSLVHTSQLEALRSELVSAREYAAKCERLIEHERERIDQKRERADRIADSILQSNGLPPISATVIHEQQEQDKILAGQRADYLKQMDEIYGESIDDLFEDGAEPVPDVVVEIARNGAN